MYLLWYIQPLVTLGLNATSSFGSAAFGTWSFAKPAGDSADSLSMSLSAMPAPVIPKLGESKDHRRAMRLLRK